MHCSHSCIHHSEWVVGRVESEHPSVIPVVLSQSDTLLVMTSVILQRWLRALKIEFSLYDLLKTADVKLLFRANIQCLCILTIFTSN